MILTADHLASGMLLDMGGRQPRKVEDVRRYDKMDPNSSCGRSKVHVKIEGSWKCYEAGSRVTVS